ncbi:penicillin-binding protein 1B, partial [Vibrio sp. 10N.222.55.E8]
MMTKMLTPKKAPSKKAPAKKSPATKAKPRKPKAAARKGKSKANSSKHRGWMKILWGIAWKVGLALIALLLFIGIYLDSVVKQRFEGQLFDLPTVVYA